jgi:DNA-binding SARP family transcriptional activator
MLALYRSGRVADALETYQSARRVHVEQLGLEPGPELRRTQEAILAHDPAIAASSVTREEAPPLTPQSSRDELGRIVDQLRANLRHAEELYAWAFGTEGIVPPRAAPPAFARLAG